MTTLAPNLHTRRQPLYDARTIPAVGGALITTFFQGAPAAAGVLGYATNMSADGQLPQPEAFELFAPRLVPALGAIVTEVALLVSCFSQIFMNNRDFYIGPGWLMPSGAGISGHSATTVAATTIAQANHGVPHPSAVMNLDDKSLFIEAQQAFRQTLDYNAPAALPVAATLMHSVWDGLHTRSAA